MTCERICAKLKGDDAMRWLQLIYAVSAVVAALAIGSPIFAFDLSGNSAASPIFARSFPGSGASHGLSDDEPQRPGSDRRAPRAPEPGEQLAQVDEARALIASRRDEIFKDPDSPVGGNPAGDVTIVEFFDYNCPYCRLAAPTLAEIERADPNVKFIYKEFPILGPGSEFAARAALAAQKQGKYMVFHRALMAYDGRIAESATMEVAQTIGLDMQKLKKDMEDSSIAAAIERNLALARALRIAATPTFVINDGIFRGAADLKAFQGVIAEARAQ